MFTSDINVKSCLSLYQEILLYKHIFHIDSSVDSQIIVKEAMAAKTGEDNSVTVASKVPFAELCGLLEKVAKTQGNDKKKRVLKDFIDKWRESHATLHHDNKDVVSAMSG